MIKRNLDGWRIEGRSVWWRKRGKEMVDDELRRNVWEDKESVGRKKSQGMIYVWSLADLCY